MTIPLDDFGKDHWSTFAYAETVCVDGHGVPDRERMRCDPTIHPGFANRANQFGGRECPTRLRGYFKPDGTKDEFRLVYGHDDWSCIDDLEAAGLIEQGGTGMYPMFRMTTLGLRVAAELRAYKASGGNCATFVPSSERE